MDTACHGDCDDDSAHGGRVYVSVAGTVYQSCQIHDQKLVSDGALTSADNGASDRRVRSAGSGILLRAAEPAHPDSAGIWTDRLSEVLSAAARVQKV